MKRVRKSKGGEGVRTLSQSDGCLGVENQEATQPGASNVNSQLRGYKHQE